MNLWSNEDINRILLQLEEKTQSVLGISFVKEKDKPVLIGRGGSANVYAVSSIEKKGKDCALKVIGFSGKYMTREDLCVSQYMSDRSSNTVKIFLQIEVWLILDDDDNIAQIKWEEPAEKVKNCLKLQLILMEKLLPVIKRTKASNIRIVPEKLAQADEREILSLASDVGKALRTAHKAGILHRDVKLENVFYSEKEKRYKLGDFGVAKWTSDGFADTVAFTKGYVAPEVLKMNLGETYDNTADIYSFGMMLFVLANGIRFPESNTYNVNSSLQYSTGFVMPKPERVVSADFYNLIKTACMYDPDDRYQSVDGMLKDVKRVCYKFGLEHYESGRKKTFIFMGAVMIVLAFMLQITGMTDGIEWISVTLIVLGASLLAKSVVFSLLSDRYVRPAFWINWCTDIGICCFILFVGLILYEFTHIILKVGLAALLFWGVHLIKESIQRRLIVRINNSLL